MEHTHEHEHTHDGVTHTHPHTHEHPHDHDHAPEGAARTKALLAYMIEAIGSFEVANVQLREVLALLEE